MTHRLVPALLLAAAVAGCGDDPPAPSAPGAPAHGHEHRAPHGGALQVLGDEAAHVELLLDAKEGRLTAYVLDAEAERPVRIAQDALRLTLRSLACGEASVELKPVASVLTGETAGDTSQFAGASDALRGATSFEGTLATITARGVKFDAVPIRCPGGNEAAKTSGVR